MYCGDDVEAVVGDVGTSRSKFGLAGEDTPTLVLPTVVGRKPPPPAGVSPEPQQQTPYVLGDLHHARDVDVLHPIEACAVANWEALEQVWKHAFEHLHVNPEEHPVITSAASCFANDALHNAANRDAEKYFEMMFEKFHVPAFYMAKDAVLDAFAFGRSSALIAEIGAGATRVVPVFDGFHLQRPAQYSAVGCNQLSEYLEHLVAKKNPALEVRPRCCFTRKVNAHGKLETLALPAEMITPPLMPGSYLKFMKSEIFRDMRESVCATSTKPLSSDAAHLAGFQQRYELPDGKVVVLEQECYEVGEFLLHPKNFAEGAGTIVKTEQHAAAATKTVAKGLHKMLYDAVQLCDADLRRDMLSNIILCGGGSLTNGLTERLHAELTAMVPSTFKVRFTNVMKIERQFSVFIGGSILASLAMVLPKATRNGLNPSGPSATSDHRSLYEAGKGNILSHFAGIATPDVSAMVPRAAPGTTGTRLRARRSLDGLNADLPPVNESRFSPKSDVRMDSDSLLSTIADDYSSDYTHFTATTDRDMEDALFGTRSGDNNNDEEEEGDQSAGKELSQKQKLEMWRRSKERGSGNRIPTHPNAKSSQSHAVQQQPPKRPKAAHAAKQQLMTKPATAAPISSFDDSNQTFENEASQMFTMDFSPPRHNRSSANSSRRATIEVDASAIALAQEDYDKKKQQSSGSDGSNPRAKSWKEASSFSGSFVGSEPFSPAMSTEFLSRDLEEEERALRAKSDKDRAYLYKKRYIDTYGFAVALARRVMRLETQRADRNTEIEVLRSKLRTQEQIIKTMSQNEMLSLPGDTSQEKQIESLCREVGALVQQLGERDSIIKNLHDERDESVRVMNAIKLSHAACKSGDCDHQRNGNGVMQQDSFMSAPQRSDEEYLELQRIVDSQKRETHSLKDQVAALRIKNEELTSDKDILEDELSTMRYKFDDIQHLYETSESQRLALSSGLQQAEEQLGVLHAQWTQEKTELLNSASYDERKTAELAAECEKFRKENAALKSSFRITSESEKKHAAIIEVQRKTAEETQQYIACLESELRELNARVGSMSEREKHFVRVESELSVTKQGLADKVSRIDELEEELQAKDDELRDAENKFHEKTIFMEKRLLQAEIVRRSLHNKVMELKGNIRVFCRVRPVLRHELSASGNEEIFSFPDYSGERRQIELAASLKSHVSYGQNGGREAVKKYNFDFDLVFDSTCSQEEVFLEVSALIQSALDGYNVCIFAYGQTGSGKTFTMQGREDSAGYETMQPSSHMGIVGRAITHIYATIADLRSSGWEFSVSLEMIEIYNETLRDLLAPPGSLDKVDLRLNADGKPAIANSCIYTVINELDAWQLLRKAMARRSTKATSMNDRSSRSHCVITFRMSGVNSLTGDRRLGVIHLVDLAGSERLNKSGSGNDRELLKEAQAINKSLSSLGNVICALAKKSAHVPFRDSKLTHFLSPSLGGDSKTLMICNLSPLKQHRDETLNSLRFAKTVNSCEIAYPSISSRS